MKYLVSFYFQTLNNDMKKSIIENIILCVEDDTDRNFTTEEKTEMLQFLESLIKECKDEENINTSQPNYLLVDEGPNWNAFVEKLKKDIKDFDETGSYYIFPKTEADWNKVVSAWKKSDTSDYIDEPDKTTRLNECKYFKDDWGGNFGFLFEDGASMELGFAIAEFVDLPEEVQLACIEIDWVAIEN